MAFFRVLSVLWALGCFGGLFIVIRGLMMANGPDPLHLTSETGLHTVAFLFFWLVSATLIAFAGAWLLRQISKALLD